MNDFFNNLCIKDDEIRQFLLEWLNFIIDGHRVNDSVNPNCFNISDVWRIDFVIDITHIPFVDQFFSQHLRLQFFLFSVIQINNLWDILV